MLLHATPSPRVRETVVGCPFEMKGVLKVFISVIYTPTFPFSLSFPPLILSGYTKSKYFKYVNLYTKLG